MFTPVGSAYNLNQFFGLVMFLPAEYDFVELIPPLNPTTINYRLGGGAGVIKRQLTLTYVGDDLSTVTRVI